jgi:hypothetical protein
METAFRTIAIVIQTTHTASNPTQKMPMPSEASASSVKRHDDLMQSVG